MGGAGDYRLEKADRMRKAMGSRYTQADHDALTQLFGPERPREDAAHLFKIAQEKKIAEDRIAAEEKAEAAAELAKADAVAAEKARLAAEESAANAKTRQQKLLDEAAE